MNIHKVQAGDGEVGRLARNALVGTNGSLQYGKDWYNVNTKSEISMGISCIQFEPIVKKNREGRLQSRK